jgi:AMMECR1 domain-containing protein
LRARSRDSWRSRRCAQDWEIGKHGLQIEFDDPQSGRHFSATYLPEVAKEQGWSKQECIDSLMRKPGFRGSVTPQLRASLRVTRYQSSKHEITYDQYCKAVAGQ